VRRYYVIRDLRDVHATVNGDHQLVTARYGAPESPVDVIAVATTAARLTAGVRLLALEAESRDPSRVVVGELYVRTDEPVDDDAWSARLTDALAAAGVPVNVKRVAASVANPMATAALQTVHEAVGGHFAEVRSGRGLHPMIAERLQLWRLVNFDVERLPSAPEVTLLDCTARDNADDVRLIALAEVRDLTTVRDADGRVVALPELEHVLAVCVDELRAALAGRVGGRRLEWNRIVLYAWPTLDAPLDELATVVRNLAPLTEGAGLEQVMVQARVPLASGVQREVVVRVSNQPGAGVTLALTDPPERPLAPHDGYTRNVLQARRRGVTYPYEIVPMLTQLPGGAAGTFEELDLDDDGELRVVERAPGRNTAGIITGLVRTPTLLHPEGMTRVVLMGDPLRSLGSLAEPECRRIIAGLALAERLGVPVEWFALSAGAKISMDSGVENMDWIAAALRRVVEFTQAGGEINVIVAGINVGAQPYWNAEATMLMHTKGILVMTPDGAMVLTGKQALDYSGGVSAEDNLGIGGYDRIMGPNGQAQYWAPDLAAACRLLFAHYEHSYVAPGERFPRRATSRDPVDRDISTYPHAGDAGLATVGDIFSESGNPGRKKPFDIRTVLRAVADQDRTPLERWADMREAETGVVFDAHLGGYAVTLIGIESKPLPRWGLLNADGPEQWSAGTLFPLSSKKVARGINAASGNRPVVVLANLSGFDGSPESLRRIQLEYGAEIGRAVVNFDGPIVFCVISRYHGGAFVVFSGALNDNMRVLALEGSYASVIGGAPAAAVVFAGEVNARTRSHPDVVTARERLEQASDPERATLEAELAAVTEAVRSDVLGAVAAEFDAIHSIERARDVGAVHEIVPARRLRPALVESIEQGMARVLGS
jgi:acetyl-CoA carboxylase carboxyltransferase component